MSGLDFDNTLEQESFLKRAKICESSGGIRKESLLTSGVETSKKQPLDCLIKHPLFDSTLLDKEDALDLSGPQFYGTQQRSQSSEQGHDHEK